MRISNIAVYGLFARFNHDLTFDPSERITIMYGPNGFGKTMILRIIDILFNSSPRSLGRMPFEELHVHFDDESRLSVVRTPDKSSPKLSFVTATQQTHSYVPESLSRVQEAAFPTSAIDEYVPDLAKVGPSEWRNVYTGEVLDLYDVLVTYADQFPFDLEISKLKFPPWLEDIRASLPVRFIDTERLIDIKRPANFSSYGHTVQHQRFFSRTIPERTIRRNSDKLASMIKQTLAEYANLSQSLDRSFPARFVEVPASEQLSKEQLARDLEEVENRRSEIVRAGLLPQEHASSIMPDIDSIDESKRSVLAVYTQDAKEKLDVFDGLNARANAFVRIANARLLYKKVSVSQDGLKVSNSDGSDLELEMLSSGEQHEIVLLFDLLFETEKNSLILVDEPELSLHVAWQRQMLEDLQEMAELSDFRALLATHSPQIIGDRWDLTVELQGPDRE